MIKSSNRVDRNTEIENLMKSYFDFLNLMIKVLNGL